MAISYRNISWAQFEQCNPDTRNAFENMCRSLFKRIIFKQNVNVITHSNPNNPGIEVEPLFDMETGKRISYQAKYFETIDYTQIRHSAEMAVKHYSGNLDLIYLYCNRDVTTTSQSYCDIKKILNEANIDLIPITNEEILDQVLNFDNIVSAYFKKHNISSTWFEKHAKNSTDSLGERYNRIFNVPTKIEQKLDLFLCNEGAINYFNQKKQKAVNHLKSATLKYSKHWDLSKRTIEKVLCLEDIGIDNIEKCFEWYSSIALEFEKEINGLKIEEEELEKEYYIEKQATRKKQLLEEIHAINHYMNSLLGLKVLSDEKELILKNVLVIKGEAGTGKSHLLAHEVEKSLGLGTGAVLLLGNQFISNDMLSNQLLNHLDLDISIDEFLGVLEEYGERSGINSVIFIDAINESVYRDIWKIGLNSLLSKTNSYNNIKVVISVRTGYEGLVFDDAIVEKIKNGSYIELFHTGFREESIEATKEFLNHYGIPFSPSYFLQQDMTNPLFLTLFCKSYTGEIFDIFSLFNNAIKKADEEVQKQIGLDGMSKLLIHLLYEIAEFKYENKATFIFKRELLQLHFWDIYGLSDKKLFYIQALEKTNVFLGFIDSNEEEYYYLAYNLMEDYIYADCIIKKIPDKQRCKEYLKNELLGINDGYVKNYHNIDVFIMACGLYAEKYGEECIDVIEDKGFDEDEQHLSEEYVRSFLWRKKKTINKDFFVEFVTSHPISTDILWSVLIECCTRIYHPLNAEFLHSILFKMPISHRDYVWTIYVNGMADEEVRLYQLILYFEKGEVLSGLTDENIELLLVLFAWILTSSNRVLRDKTSKAMIEILKRNFIQCKSLLERFENVNDPYVIQRLYGIVFGACVKRVEKSKTPFYELVKYIYSDIFNQPIVYEDILLRDYAKLIIERFIYEFPNDSEEFDKKIISPPYNSIAIPNVDKNDHYDSEYKNKGYNHIVHSMKLEGMGMYGDFGRYVFQAALAVFDGFDVENAYYYALQFIREQLEYEEEYFGEYDSRTYMRHISKKTERIGKKYQWIAMYHILAKAADVHQVKQIGEEAHPYYGPYEPYVRDFDPTLNTKISCTANIPVFEINDKVTFITSPDIDEEAAEEWKKEAENFFGAHANNLILTDIDGVRWVLLNQYKTVKYQNGFNAESSFNYSNGSQSVSLRSIAYFAKCGEFADIRQAIKNRELRTEEFPDQYSTYEIYNREYAWSQGCKNHLGSTWFDCEVDTGKMEEVIQELSELPEELKKLFGFLEKEKYYLPIRKSIGSIITASNYFLWEEEYDASQEEATGFYIPCNNIIEHLELEQREYDGYYYSTEGVLVSFDGELSNSCKGLVIRQDYLNRYLEEKGYRMFWSCRGEKQYFKTIHDQIWSEWAGFMYYENNEVIGEMEIKD